MNAPGLAGMLDFVLAVFAIEAVALWLYHRITGAGVAPADVGPSLAAGALLLLAARLALADAALAAVGTCLAVAGGAHVFDLRRRWRSR